MVFSLCVCLSVCVTLQLRFLKARGKLSTDMCNNYTHNVTISQANSLGTLVKKF